MKQAMCLIALCALGPAGASAQQPSFRSGTSLVEVTVIVRDGKGAFIPGLTIDDFEITEEGRPQRIQTLYVATAPRRGDDAAAAALPSGGTRTADRAFIFLFDMAHLSPASLTRARDAVATFAKARLQRSDLSGMAAVGGTSQVQVSGDHPGLVEAVRALRPRGDAFIRERQLRLWPRLMSAFEATQIANDVARALERAVERNCLERDMDCTPMPPGTFETEANRQTTEGQLRMKARDYVRESRMAARTSLGALEQIAGALSQLPGRKTIVWFTEGSGSDEAAEQARTTVMRAAESGVAVYAVDPRGLSARLSGADDVEISELGWDAVRGMAEDLPNFLAAGTGGLYIRNENRMDRALARIEDDTSTYYVLGYEPAEDRAREYRRIRVTVRRAGVSIRARHGYTAQRPSIVTASAPPAALPLPGRAPLNLLAVPRSVPATVDAAAVRRPPTGPPPPPGVTTGTTVESEAGTSASGLVLRPDAALQVESLAGGAIADGSALATEGWTAYQRGDLESAVGPLARAAEAPGARPWVLYALGLTQAGLGRPADAIQAWERARAGAPEFDAVYIDLAATYAHVGDLARALDVLRDAGRRWPRSADVHNGIGVIHVRRGALDEAIAAFTAAAESAPGDPLALFNLARTYELRFGRSERYVSSQRRWTTDDQDRRLAIAHYETYLKMGGPHAAEVRAALRRLEWSK